MRVGADSPLGRRMRDREMLIGSSPRKARGLGIKLHPRFDGSGPEVDAVLWATGFSRDHSWIHAPGVHYLGLPWQTTRGSALLGWVGHDAERVALRCGRGQRERERLPVGARP
jgi:putative flavoprotein involved in K+ transport